MDRMRRILAPIAIGVVLGQLLACGVPPRLYRDPPVDGRGAPIDFSRIRAIVLESRDRHRVGERDTVRFLGDRIVIQHPGAKPEDETYLLDEIAAVEFATEGGRLEAVDVRTPDDLLDFPDLPRIDRIRTRDGRTLGGEGFDVRWSLDRLGLVVHEGDSMEEIPLSEVAEVELYDPDFLHSTLASPAFWAVGAVAAGLVVWIGTRQDEDSLATR